MNLGNDNIYGFNVGTSPVEKIYLGSELVYPFLKVRAYYNVTGNTTIQICSATSAFIAAKVDDTTDIQVSTGYTFSSTGTHYIDWTLPGNSLGEYAFLGCASLSRIDLPDGLVRMERQSLRLTGISAITIPSSVVYIENAALHSTRLRTCTIPSTVTFMAGNILDSCSVLTGAVINANIQNVPASTFQNAKNLTSVTLPSTIKRIDHDAFINCAKLTAITIPSGVTSIADNAFKYCAKLTEIVALPETAPTLGSDVFTSVKSTGTLKVRSNDYDYSSWMDALPEGWTKQIIS